MPEKRELESIYNIFSIVSYSLEQLAVLNKLNSIVRSNRDIDTTSRLLLEVCVENISNNLDIPIHERTTNHKYLKVSVEGAILKAIKYLIEKIERLTSSKRELALKVDANLDDILDHIDDLIKKNATLDPTNTTIKVTEDVAKLLKLFTTNSNLSTLEKTILNKYIPVTDIESSLKVITDAINQPNTSSSFLSIAEKLTHGLSNKEKKHIFNGVEFTVSVDTSKCDFPILKTSSDYFDTDMIDDNLKTAKVVTYNIPPLKDIRNIVSSLKEKNTVISDNIVDLLTKLTDLLERQKKKLDTDNKSYDEWCVMEFLKELFNYVICYHGVLDYNIYSITRFTQSMLSAYK